MNGPLWETCDRLVCSWNARARTIFEATKTHSMNLMKYVALYKALLLIQKKVNGGKERRFDTFFAGLVGGYLVFGDRNPVNEQVRALFFFFFFSSSTSPCVRRETESNVLDATKVVLYICSRVIASFIPRAIPTQRGSTAAAVRPVPPDSRYFSIFAAIVWGCVMWAFEHRGESIQPGMFNSMTYLYRDSNVWTDLRTLLWHNR